MIPCRVHGAQLIMSVRVKRTSFDFLARNYATASPEIEILRDGYDRSMILAQPSYKKNFIERWYISLQGEDTPTTSGASVEPDKPTDLVFRYDWAFGIAVIQGFWWDWQKDLCDDDSIAVHLLLEPTGDAPEPVPVACTLSALRPSRNTQTVWEQAWPELMKVAVSAVKTGAPAIPGLAYLSEPLNAMSTVLDSRTGQQKNWFLYQFFDEIRKCPTVEWRINKGVMREYGPLLRGSLFLRFHGSAASHPGKIRIHVRPQVRYHSEGDLDFIVPTEVLPEAERIFLDVTPQD